VPSYWRLRYGMLLGHEVIGQNKKTR